MSARATYIYTISIFDISSAFMALHIKYKLSFVATFTSATFHINVKESSKSYDLGNFDKKK